MQENAQFQFSGFQFTGVRSLTPKEKALDLKGLTRHLRSVGFHKYDRPGLRTDWDYEKFYCAAQQAGCGDYEIFSVNLTGKEILVIPGENELFQWLNKPI